MLYALTSSISSCRASHACPRASQKGTEAWSAALLATPPVNQSAMSKWMFTLRSHVRHFHQSIGILQIRTRHRNADPKFSTLFYPTTVCRVVSCTSNYLLAGAESKARTPALTSAGDVIAQRVGCRCLANPCLPFLGPLSSACRCSRSRVCSEIEKSVSPFRSGHCCLHTHAPLPDSRVRRLCDPRESSGGAQWPRRLTE